MLELKGLRLSRGGRELCSGIDLRLQEPGITVLAGKAGSGKSTLLRVLKGLLPPEAGVRRLQGWREEQIGLLLPDPANQLLSDSVLGEISLPLRYQGLPRKEILSRSEQQAAALGLEHLLSRDPRSLSGGEQQLVCLASLLVQKPSLLLLDEPFLFLDADHRLRLIHELLRLAEEHTLLLVSHRREAARLGRRLLELGPQGLREVDAAEQEERAAELFVEEALAGLELGPAGGEQGLRLGQLSFGWPGRPVFHRLELELPVGKGALLCGPQGSGKSSLLLLLSGLEQPTAGRIEAPGRVAPLFQFAERQFLGEGREGRSLSSSERRLAALDHLLDRAPACLALDEPFAGLDPASCRALADRLRSHRAAGGSLLVLSHQPTGIAALDSTIQHLPDPAP